MTPKEVTTHRFRLVVGFFWGLCSTAVHWSQLPSPRAEIGCSGIKEPGNVWEQSHHSLLLSFSFPSCLLGSQTLLQVRQLNSGLYTWGYSGAPFLGCFSTEDTSPPQCSCSILGGTCRPTPCWHQQDESSQSPYRNGGSCAGFPLLRLRAGDKVFLLLAWPVRTHRTPKALWLLNGALSGSWRRSSWQNA